MFAGSASISSSLMRTGILRAGGNQRVSLEDYSVSNRGLRAGLVGTAESVAERIAAFEAAGLDLMLLQFSPQYEEMERFAADVIPLFRQAPAATSAT